MFISNKHISRRTVLRGMGAAVALPLLEAMVPARSVFAQGAAAAAALAHRLRSVKGFAGGRIYINEAGEFFAPIPGRSNNLSYLYLGPLGEDQWFPPPDVDRRSD